MSTLTKLRVGDFDVSVSLYSENAVVIIHDSIPGFGNIIYTEKRGSGVECDQLLGAENDLLTLFATTLAKLFSTECITFIMAFHPSKMEGFDDIRAFTDSLRTAIETSRA